MEKTNVIYPSLYTEGNKLRYIFDFPTKSTGFTKNWAALTKEIYKEGVATANLYFLYQFTKYIHVRYFVCLSTKSSTLHKYTC